MSWSPNAGRGQQRAPPLFAGAADPALEFFVDRAPTDEALAQVARSVPRNPLYTVGYVRAMADRGSRAWLVGLRRGEARASVCPAFLDSTRPDRSLKITSLPAVIGPDAFFGGLLALCRSERIRALTVNTVASADCPIPRLAGEVARKSRREYVLDLSGTDLWRSMHTKHRYRVKRARKHGLEFRWAHDEDACERHLQAKAASLRRRQERGETVSRAIPREFRAFLDRGAGQIAEAVSDGEVLSSAFFLIAERGALYKSAGTREDGMRCGASHFLLYSAARELQARGLERLSLGGSPFDTPEGGLNEFKARFGGSRNDLEAVTCRFEGRLRSALQSWKRSLRGQPARRAGD